MAYINTYNTTGSKLLVQVFPSARRVATQSSARMFSEKSIVEITNKLIDTDGFVISDNASSGYVVTTSPFEFDLYGYYFYVDRTDLIINAVINENAESKNIYAKIILDGVPSNSIDFTQNKQFQELHGQDTNPGTDNPDSVYTGVEFVSSLPAVIPQNEKYLLLLTLSNGLWKIPDSSKRKFSLKSIEFDFAVDGGVLNTFQP